MKAKKLFRETFAEGYIPVALKPYDYTDRWEMVEDGVHWRQITWFKRFPSKANGCGGDSRLWFSLTTADKADAWIRADVLD